MDKMDWIDKQEKVNEEKRVEGYMSIEEGDNKFFILSHCAALAQVWDGSKYRPAEEGDKNVSIKGVCWVLQDGKVKEAKLPYTAVKLIRTYQNDSEWDLGDFPWEHQINLTAKGAKSKEVEYGLVLSPKKTPIPADAKAELKKKSTPEDVVERIKGRAKPVSAGNSYPEEDIDTSLTPF